MAKSEFIERLEMELLSAMLRYVVPFIGKKIKPYPNSNLERIVSGPRIDLNDIKRLEAVIEASQNLKPVKKFGMSQKEISYSVEFRRQAGKKDSKHSISIDYEENAKGDRLKISVKSDGKGVYSAEIAGKKEQDGKIAPYRVKIVYEDNYGEERLSIAYRQQLKNYMKQHIKDKEDMTNRVPLKWLNILPETMMGGVLGFTYLGENFMGRRADLTGKTARMVDIHESIHTPDEYETRQLTSWIMSKERSKYVK